MQERSGSCLCGAVQYRVIGEPLVARVCWCHICQKISGNGTANAIFPGDAIAVTGSMDAYRSVADSGNEITRHFCATCGCHLFASSSATPQFRVVRIGTLHEPSSIQPQLNIWASSAPAWACMDPSLKREAGQPGPPRTIPPASSPA